MSDAAESRCYTNALDASSLAKKLEADLAEAEKWINDLRKRAESARRLATRCRMEYETRYPDDTGLGNL